ncbi:hypothetical protein BGZ63DRAFT_405448 [Mariannaea sp. PMI_226]|nr:hypothetical protein BGZ63DRAFT_405448 [Mariannaea sp. PMI_226]
MVFNEWGNLLYVVQAEKMLAETIAPRPLKLESTFRKNTNSNRHPSSSSSPGVASRSQLVDPPTPRLRSASNQTSWPSAVPSATTQMVPVAETAATRSSTLPTPDSERHHSFALSRDTFSDSLHKAKAYPQLLNPPHLQQPLHRVPHIPHTRAPPPSNPHMHQHQQPDRSASPFLLRQHATSDISNVPPRHQHMQYLNSSSPLQEAAAYGNLSNIISPIDENIVRQDFRDQWEKAILGSQYHISFLLNAIIQQASNETLSHVVKDFGARMIQVTKEHAVRHLKADDIDDVADLLLSQASSSFLDKALVRRLQSIPARQLVNALAQAERLGYNEHDIIKEGRNGLEHVIHLQNPITFSPQANYTPPPISHTSHAPPLPHINQMAPGVGNSMPVDKSTSPSLFFCYCGWPCSSPQALKYHKKKQNCGNVLPLDRIGREVCPHCGSRFSSAGGLYYHTKVKVCGEYTRERTREVAQAIRVFYTTREADGPMVLSTPSKFQASPPMHSAPAQSSGRYETYVGLTPNQKRELDEQMREAEEYYGTLMRSALALPEPERSKHLAVLKNRYNTKKSNTRKKYGIRLRGRRTKAEINAERSRLFETAD